MNTIIKGPARLATTVALVLCLGAASTDLQAFGGSPVDEDPASAYSLEGKSASEVEADVAQVYSEIALAAYGDALMLARELHSRILEFIARPSAETLAVARQAWLDARPPYQQTEVYRFGNEIVDEWEGKVNAWPIDEGFIDYVDVSYGKHSEGNPLSTANIVSSERISIDGRQVDISALDTELLAGLLQEAGGIETNIATGYHAVEFLLWGQDLNPADARMSSGQRPASDYAKGKACGDGHCQRRALLLRTVSELIMEDLAEMVRAWSPSGQARQDLASKGVYEVALTGIVELAAAELAGERMRVGLELHDQEEEHDCFSDNTHNSHFYNLVGIENVYYGRYLRHDGRTVQGASLAAVVASLDSELDARLRTRLKEAREAVGALVASYERKGEPYDWLLDAGNPEGNAMIQASIDSLLKLAEAGESVMALLVR